MAFMPRGDVERALASGFVFNRNKSDFVVETPMSLSMVGVVVGMRCGACDRLFKEPLAAEYQGLKGMAMRAMFPVEGALSSGGDTHVYFKGKAYCWSVHEGETEWYRLLAPDRIICLDLPISEDGRRGPVLANVFEDFRHCVPRDLGFLFRLVVIAPPESAQESSTVEFEDSLPSVSSSDDNYRDNDYCDEDYDLGDYQEDEFDCEAEYYRMEAAGEFGDEGEFDDEEEIYPIAQHGVYDVKDRKVLHDARSEGLSFYVDPYEIAYFKEFSHSAFQFRSLSLGNVFSVGELPDIWSMTIPRCNIDSLFSGTLSFKDRGRDMAFWFPPSIVLRDWYVRPNVQTRECMRMTEALGESVISFLRVLSCVKTGCSPEVVNNVMGFLNVDQQKTAFVKYDRKVSCILQGCINPIRVFRFIIGFLALRKFSYASEFLHSVQPFSIEGFSVDVKTFEELLGYGLDYASNDFRVMALAGDKILRLILAYACVISGKNVLEWDVLTKKYLNVHAFCSVPIRGLGFSKVTADRYRVLFFIYFVHNFRKVSAFGRHFGLFDEWIWHIWDNLVVHN